MGNLCFCWRNRFVGGIRRRKVLQVVDKDGRVLKFTSPMLVQDVVASFSGMGIVVSKQGSRDLPGNYELKLGRVYYMIPLSSLEEDVGRVRRVKIVITKQKLQELLAKQISMADVVAASYSSVRSSSNWRPKLEAIPEEIDDIENNSSAYI